MIPRYLCRRANATVEEAESITLSGMTLLGQVRAHGLAGGGVLPRSRYAAAVMTGPTPGTGH
jgi:hypothetical protein